MKLTSLRSVFFCCLLTGCAGMNSDFECNKTATDQCLTMGEANALALQGKSLDSLQGGAAAKKPVDETLSLPANRPPVLKPLSASTVAPRPIPPSTLTSNSIAPVSSMSTSATTTGQRAVNTSGPGSVNAYRVPDQVQRLWVAPWVDNDDAFHQPAVVEFVKKPARWDDSYQTIGSGE
ncbi:type IV conjugative transfer system lipoprotein TraV [Serratia proteamaculans]|uniref:type IV conjugative transfer system lipoprotein TraV n=1 Tax=Serratia proteamaculans TaxID=28151 RepID=UPI0039BE773C